MTVHKRGGDGRCRRIEIGQLLRFVDRAPQRTISIRLFSTGPHQPPLLPWSRHGPALLAPKAGPVLQPPPNATRRSMIDLAASAFPWPGHEIPSRSFVTGTPCVQSCYCAPMIFVFEPKLRQRQEPTTTARFVCAGPRCPRWTVARHDPALHKPLQAGPCWAMQ
jgi:hypothetical protein